MTASLPHLPPELYSAIFSCVPIDSLQHTVLALTRALPRSPIPLYHLFQHVRLKRAEQVVLLYLRLRKNAEDAAIVRGFSLECWSVDADVLVNLVALMPQLTELKLFVGPDFAPEHLEEIFQKPRDELTLISLRFRPYVQKATYYQFLKGAYFDSTLVTLSNWPTTALPTLSVVQDPLDPTIAPDHFAQPLVFFRLQPLGSLALSPLAADLTSFRLRIPGRKVAQYLYALPRTLPRVELLDLSTCNVLDTDVEGILGRFGHLKALVLDGCAVVSQRADILGQAEPTSQWAALGKTMALAGVKRAREREKKVKAWREAGYAALPTIAEPAPAQQAAPRRSKRGRRGLATATISLRASPSRDNEVPAQAVSTHRLPPPSQKIRILPFAPILQSIALTTPPAVGPEMHGAIREEFGRGWAEGIAQLSAIRARLRQSWRNGVRVLMFSEEIDDEVDESEGDGEVGLSGLVDVDVMQTFEGRSAGCGNRGEDGVQEEKCPLLCLAGPGRKDGHVEGCGHQLGWAVWHDEV